MLRKGIAVILGFVLVSGLIGTAMAAAPDGPRLAVLKWSFRPERSELLTVDQVGDFPLRLAGGGRNRRPLPADGLSWSPDGGQIAFSGLVGDANALSTSRLFVVGADGRALRQLPGTKGAYSPVFSPDGHTVAFANWRDRAPVASPERNYWSVSIWLTDIAGGRPRRITPWRNGLRQTPSSFSPDGSVLAITRAVKTRPAEAVALRVDGSGSTVLAHKAVGPVFSPDGSRIAFLRGPRRVFKEEDEDGSTGLSVTLTDLYTMNLDGSGLRRLTRTPRATELAPGWDPSGQRLVYAESKVLKSHLRTRDSLIQVNSDGSCPMTIISEPLTELFGAAWQPGPGREAGRIEC